MYVSFIPQMRPKAVVQTTEYISFGSTFKALWSFSSKAELGVASMFG